MIYETGTLDNPLLCECIKDIGVSHMLNGNIVEAKINLDQALNKS